jgi:sugar lactone lactonase YvrE/DNA-directed RNA polymerase subunit RPC12/RpoP
MTDNDSAQIFKCPSCGAPLDIEVGAASMKCQYCSETVIIPAALRIPARPVFESAAPRTSAPQSYTPVQTKSPAPAANRSSCLGSVVTVGFVVVILSIISIFALGYNPFGSFLFASQTLKFGSEGIGPGLFQDPRSVAVDGKGNIIVADYGDGRIQTFSPDGKFMSTFTVKNSQGKPANILGIAVSHDGKIYVPDSDILIFDESGKQLGKIAGDIHHDYLTDIALGSDGAVYAFTFGDDNLVRLKADGSIDLEIPSPIDNITGQPGGFPHIAVDGLGNIYVAADNPDVILKYSPDGKFLNQFGGKPKDITQFEAGKFVDPLGIAIDGYGRIFVNDSYDLQVFDSSGKYLNNISGGYYGIAFDEQNNLYTTPVTKNDVVKFNVKKPAGQ